MSDGDPAAGGVVLCVGALGAGEGGGEQQQQREVGGGGVVLLVGGEGEEDQDEGGEEAEKKGGALGEGCGSEEWCAVGGVGLAALKALKQKEGKSDKDSEEIRDMRGVSESETDDDSCEGLPVEALIFGKRIGLAVALKAGPRLADERAEEQGPGEEPDEVEGPEEIAWKLVVVPGVTTAEEAEEVLVDEVEPEEAVAIHAAGVAEAGEDVPGGGDGEEEEHACDGLQGAPVFVFIGQGKIEDRGAEEEDQSDEALGEDGQGDGCPHDVGVGGGGEILPGRRRTNSCNRRDFGFGGQGTIFVQDGRSI